MERKLTEDMVENLKQDYGSMSTNELVKKYNCSYSTIERFCKKHGFKSKREPTCKTQPKYPCLYQNIQEFLKDWNENVLSIREMEEKYSAPSSAMYSHAILHGIHRKTLKERININDLVKDYEDKILSQTEICEKYGISQSFKSLYFKESGFKLDVSGERNRKYEFNQHYLDFIDNEEKAYFLGFVYADGSHSEDRHTLNITIQQGDENILRLFYKLFDCNKDITYVYNKTYDKYYSNFCLRSVYLSNKLLELGVSADKSFKIKFPDFLPEQLERHFIRGYFDGDGCISVHSRGWKSTDIKFISNKIFLEGISEVIQKNTGISMNLAKEKTSEVYDLRKAGVHNLYSILNYIYKDSTIYLQRKYKRYINFITEYEWEFLQHESN